ncbi:MAG: RNA methyltransferase [Betaproteobacteria bacterium]|nr:RNA methyltransferase [Betaproteobacteria bacterium]
MSGMEKSSAECNAFQPLLCRVRWVLVSPTHAGNVGASARAIATMGFSRLLVAAPEDPALIDDPQVQTLSAGALEHLTEMRNTASLEEALFGTRLQLAFTARPREFEPPRRTLVEAAHELANALCQEGQDEVALVFGPERAGLSNADLMRCSRVCGLDVNSAFSSLNLSQAVQVAAYVLRDALRAASRAPAAPARTDGLGRPTAKPAAHEQVEGLHAHLMRVAEQVGALDPQAPGRMDDRLRRLWTRAGVWEDEAQMLRGVLTAIERKLL